jgi:hypothetical protein
LHLTFKRGVGNLTSPNAFVLCGDDVVLKNVLEGRKTEPSAKKQHDRRQAELNPAGKGYEANLSLGTYINLSLGK